MRLFAAKCPNCGAKIDLKKDVKIYYCEYCKYDIILDETNHASEKNKSLSSNENVVYIDGKINFFKLFMFVPIIIFIIIVVTMFIIPIFSEVTKNDNEYQVSVDNFNFIIDKTGEQSANMLATMLDHVVENINDTDRKIVIVFEGEEVADITSFKNIVESDLSLKYYITSEIDADGYINKINIISYISSTNFNFSIDNMGYLSGSTIANILEGVISNLEKYNKDIIISYNNAVYIEITDIQNLMLSFDKNTFVKYNVLNEKDENGYINMIEIND